MTTITTSNWKQLREVARRRAAASNDACLIEDGLAAAQAEDIADQDVGAFVDLFNAWHRAKIVGGDYTDAQAIARLLASEWLFMGGRIKADELGRGLTVLDKDGQAEAELWLDDATDEWLWQIDAGDGEYERGVGKRQLINHIRGMNEGPN